MGREEVFARKTIPNYPFPDPLFSSDGTRNLSETLGMSDQGTTPASPLRFIR